MKHPVYQEWLKYVKNELSDDVREGYDDHLYSCDECLQSYLQALSEFENELPALSNADTFTDSIMAEISANKPKNNKHAPFYQKTIFHYTIAAAITILFMTSGVFQSITNVVGSVQTPRIEENSPSVTEELMNKTFAWMDSFEMKNREAGN